MKNLLLIPIALIGLFLMTSCGEDDMMEMEEEMEQAIDLTGSWMKYRGCSVANDTLYFMCNEITSDEIWTYMNDTFSDSNPFSTPIIARPDLFDQGQFTNIDTSFNEMLGEITYFGYYVDSIRVDTFSIWRTSYLEDGSVGAAGAGPVYVKEYFARL